MKKLVALVITSALFFAAPLAYAQAIKIGVFDMDRVFNESKRWAKEREAYMKLGKELKQAFDKKAAELNAFREQLEKKAGMLSEQARKEKEREYQQKAKELERLGQDSEAELRRVNQESAAKFQKSLSAVLKKLGEEEKYTLILEQSLVPYASKEIDITDKVIKAFDAAKE